MKATSILLYPLKLSPLISAGGDVSDDTYSFFTQASTLSIILMNSSTDMIKGLLPAPPIGIQAIYCFPFVLRKNIIDTSLGITKVLVKRTFVGAEREVIIPTQRKMSY